MAARARACVGDGVDVCLGAAIIWPRLPRTRSRHPSELLFVFVGRSGGYCARLAFRCFFLATRLLSFAMLLLLSLICAMLVVRQQSRVYAPYSC